MPVILLPNDYFYMARSGTTHCEERRYLFDPYTVHQIIDRLANPFVNKCGNEGPMCLKISV